MFKSVRVSSTSPRSAPTVIGVFKDRKLEGSWTRLAGDPAVRAALKRAGFSGDTGSITEVHGTGKGGEGTVLLAGLGEKTSFAPSSLRAVAGAVAKRINALEVEHAVIEMTGATGSAKRVDASLSGRCFGEGLGLAAWNFDGLKGTGSKPATRRPLAVSCEHEAFAAGMQNGLHLADGANFARDLSQTPPNIATTDYIAAQARTLARRTGMSCRVFAGADLEREKFVGLLNVGKASENKPCMIRLEFAPKSRAARGSRPIVLVGKTMTYDTGGLSLKINNSMVGMKRDKDGGCAVLGAMHIIANHLRPDRRVVALLACAENSISDEAYRPDDVIRYRNGVTVEVTNTDAEGRLVLADALCWACEKEDPECIVDMATLTGGVVVALGDTFAGMFCEDARLRTRLDRAMESSGERFWRLPMDPEYRDLMKSPIADILNSNPNRKAHPIQGAAFLSYFVKEEIPWAHLDIAGVHATESDKGPFCKGPTGWGARLLADFVAHF